MIKLYYSVFNQILENLDGSDEKNCLDRQCFPTEFRCSTGRCIPSNWVSYCFI